MAYNKTVWENDMIIEADALNNIEEGIFNIEEKVNGLDIDLTEYKENIKFDDDEDMILLPTKSIVLGTDDDTASRRLQIERAYQDGHTYESTVSITDDKDLELTLRNSYTGRMSGISLGLNSLRPTVYNLVDLGTEDNKFNNLHLKGYALAEGGLTFDGGQNITGTDGKITIKNNEEKVFLNIEDKTITDVEGLDVHFTTDDGNIYFNPTKLNGNNSTNFGNPDKGFEVHTGTGTWRITPFGGINCYLGYPNSNNRWTQCYLKNAVNVSSDRNLKENIVYLDDKEAVNRNTVITTDDMYSFIKDDLKLTKYNLITTSEMEHDNKDIIGFIAQDVKESGNVGNYIITEDEDGKLGYDTGSYTNVLAGALQVALNKIEDLENRLAELEAKM